MKLDSNSRRNQDIIWDYMWGIKTLKQTQEVLKECGDYTEEEGDTSENP